MIQLNGSAIEPFLETLTTLRLEIFQEYPYLYQGTRSAELSYLRSYCASPEAVVMVQQCDGQLAGAVTAIPLQDEPPELTAPFADTAYALESLYYIGELLFYPPYRNQGFGTQLLTAVEQHARNCGGYRCLTCATVQRPADHPYRPDEYVPIERFLARSGFVPLAGVTTTFAWCELDGINREHVMQFWLKELC